MRIAIIGGKLQGVEAAYLARKAGFETLLIDKNPNAPALSLCDSFLVFEFTHETPFPRSCPQIDLILPALEDDGVLFFLEEWSRICGISLAFDGNAYAISSSKIKSDALFLEMKLPAPKPWPLCSFPVIIKPDQSSGSRGVEIIKSKAEFHERFPEGNKPDGYVIQEYIEGPSYSIEVLGRPGAYQALQVTDLGMDKDWDCNLVTAPTRLIEKEEKRFKEMAVELATALKLTGIMDLEVILHNGELKLLEIDARLPSQTPMAVYSSTGINMVALIADLFCGVIAPPIPLKDCCALIEHIRVNGSIIEFPGEHIMAQYGLLFLKKDFFGADEAVTSFTEGKKSWVATMIFTGPSFEDIEKRRAACYNRIKKASTEQMKDQSP